MVRPSLLWALPALAQAVQLDVTSEDSIRSAAKKLASHMMSFYTGDQPGQIPGILPGNGEPGGYFWWVGGGMFGTMVNYWYYTGDDTWNNQTLEALVFQSAPDEGGYFEPSNQTLQLGNDDTAFWALAAMAAAEYNFPNPPPDKPQWLAMAQGTFQRQYNRWDPNTCGGGLRWQVFPFNNGYDYKNSISNGCFFNLAARLAKYTGNSTYAEAATRWYEWTEAVNLIDITQNYRTFDGVVVPSCSYESHTEQWTYNVGVYLLGAANMWNHTGDDIWRTRTEGLLNATEVFFMNDPTGDPNAPKVLTEVICEPQDTCKIDQSSFKAYLARWMTATAKVAPFTADRIRQMLIPSAEAAAVACSAPGADGGNQCGEKWYTGQYDGKVGIGMQMNAMEVIQTLIDRPGPVEADQGTSQGDVNAGTSGGRNPGKSNIINITTADKAGASILTVALAIATLSGAFWIVK